MKFLLTSALLSAAVLSTGCLEQSAKSIQAEKAQDAANSISFTENSEIENIKRRLELTSSVSKIGYVVLLNQAGQPIAYETVKGKVTSGSKRLTAVNRVDAGGRVLAAPSDEGTHGSSDPYIYFWTPSGKYVQWNGSYLYSDQPIRLRVEPLIISVQ